ncbi:MAG: MerR family transcriptional regulator [Verrucomicrobiales bacterium]
MNSNKNNNHGNPTLQNRGSLLSRNQLAKRWGVSKETIKRREREGLLTPIRFNQRLLRYRLDDIVALEQSLLA